MKDSIDYELNRTVDSVYIEMFHNPKHMGYEYPSFFSDQPQDNRENIVNWLNNGTTNRFFSHPAHNFIETAEVKFKKDIGKIMMNGLKNLGWDAK